MAVEPCEHCGKEFTPKTNQWGRNLHVSTCKKNPNAVKGTNTTPAPAPTPEQTNTTITKEQAAAAVEQAAAQASEPCPNVLDEEGTVCGAPLFKPQPFCASCGAKLRW